MTHGLTIIISSVFSLFFVATVAFADSVGIDADEKFAEGLRAYEVAEGSGNVAHEGYHKAFALWKPLAENGHARAEYYLAELYWRSLGGATFDPDTAIKYTRRSAERGYAPAQYSLGHQYEHGHFLPSDEERALKWYKRSATVGYWLATERLGMAFDNGELGLEVDADQARKWRSLRR